MFGGISAPDDSVAAIVGYSGAGILVFDLSDKTKPRPVYQNSDKTSESVYTAKIGGTRYAFMAAPTPGGLYVYNLDKALTFNGCLEDNSSAGNCPGVLVSKVQTTASAASFVHGVGNYVVVSFGGTGGFQIFDMSNPVTRSPSSSACAASRCRASRCGTRARRTTSAPARARRSPTGSRRRRSTT